VGEIGFGGVVRWVIAVSAERARWVKSGSAEWARWVIAVSAEWARWVMSGSRDAAAAGAPEVPRARRPYPARSDG